MLFQVLSGFKPIFYTTHPNEEPYIFTNEDSRITLYYEPVIYDEDRTNVNGISLYRNNSISLNRETDDERQGHYYVPDYVAQSQNLWDLGFLT